MSRVGKILERQQIVRFEFDMDPRIRIPAAAVKAKLFVVGEKPRIGFEFGTDGKCTKIPSGGGLPAKICVKPYPLIERAGWVWIWMGASSQVATCVSTA